MSLRGLVCLCGDRVGLCCVGVGVTFGGGRFLVWKTAASKTVMLTWSGPEKL